eukprot:6292496-Amphidinium_carterae.1
MCNHFCLGCKEPPADTPLSTSVQCSFLLWFWVGISSSPSWLGVGIGVNHNFPSSTTSRRLVGVNHNLPSSTTSRRQLLRSVPHLSPTHPPENPPNPQTRAFGCCALALSAIGVAFVLGAFPPPPRAQSLCLGIMCAHRPQHTPKSKA